MPVKWNIYGLIPKAIVWCRCSTSSRKCWMSWLEHRECCEIKNVFTWKKDIMLLILTLDSDWMVFTIMSLKIHLVFEICDKFSISIFLIFSWNTYYLTAEIFRLFIFRMDYHEEIQHHDDAHLLISSLCWQGRILFLKCYRFQSFLK